MVRPVEPERDAGVEEHPDHHDAEQHAELAENGVQPPALGRVQHGEHPRGVLVDTQGRREHEQEHHEQDIARGVGEVVIPPAQILGNERNALVDGVDIDDILLVFVVIVGRQNAGGEQVLLLELGGNDDVAHILGEGVDVFLLPLKEPVNAAVVPVFFGFLVLLALGVHDLKVRGQAVVLDLEGIGVGEVELPFVIEVLGEVVAVIAIGLGFHVHQRGVDEEQKHENGNKEPIM